MPDNNSEIFKAVSEKKSDLLISMILFFISLGYILLHSTGFFFWDTISQVSAPANWYFDNNFSSLLIPDEITTGHPPFFAMYIALAWKIFGKSLLVSHMAMLPFLFGLFHQAYRFLKRTETTIPVRLLIMAALFADTSLLSQMSLVTFEIPQLFFFLWSINALLEKRRNLLAIAFTLLCLISLRGSIAASGVVLFSLARDYLKSGKVNFRSVFPFFPGFIFLVIFLIYFYLEKHWIIHNTVSGRWEQSAQFASLYEIFRNGVIIIWRLADFGRVGILIVLIFILFRSAKRKNLVDGFFSETVLIAASQLIAIAPFILFSRNFIGHRYLLPVIVMVSISVVYWIIKYSVYPRIILPSVLFVLLSGHFWIYPITIAQGWDATTAHWPYYRVREDMIDYMKSENIPFKFTGSFFPNLARFDDIDLSGSKDAFRQADLDTDSLILFSNIFNVPDPVINELYSSGEWNQKHFIAKGGVFMVLFERRKNPVILLRKTPLP